MSHAYVCKSVCTGTHTVPEWDQRSKKHRISKLLTCPESLGHAGRLDGYWELDLPPWRWATGTRQSRVACYEVTRTNWWFLLPFGLCRSHSANSIQGAMNQDRLWMNVVEKWVEQFVTWVYLGASWPTECRSRVLQDYQSQCFPAEDFRSISSTTRNATPFAHVFDVLRSVLSEWLFKNVVPRCPQCLLCVVLDPSHWLQEDLRFGGDSLLAESLKSEIVRRVERDAMEAREEARRRRRTGAMVLWNCDNKG